MIANLLVYEAMSAALMPFSMAKATICSALKPPDTGKSARVFPTFEHTSSTVAQKSDLIASNLEAKASDFRAHSQVRAIAGGVSARPIAVHNRFIQKQVSRPDLLPRLDDLQKVINDIRNTLSEPLEGDYE